MEKVDAVEHTAPDPAHEVAAFFADTATLTAQVEPGAAALFALGKTGAALGCLLQASVQHCEKEAGDPALSVAAGDALMVRRDEYRRSLDRLLLVLARVRELHVAAQAREEQTRRQKHYDSALAVLPDACTAMQRAEKAMEAALQQAELARVTVARANAALPEGATPIPIPEALAEETVVSEAMTEGWQDPSGAIYTGRIIREAASGGAAVGVGGAGEVMLKRARFRKTTLRLRGRYAERVVVEALPAEPVPSQAPDVVRSLHDVGLSYLRRRT